VTYAKNFDATQPNEAIFDAIKEERETIGYYSLPFQDTKEINSFAATVTKKHIAVIGIGGSSLGTFAIYDFLKRTNNYSKELHFFESTDPIDINDRIKQLDLEDTLFVVISKSGTTVEMVSTFKYLHTKTIIDSSNCVIISESDSKLTQYANKNSMKTFVVPKDVGGRFSVFSTVGLVPLACVGVNIDELLGGCQDTYNSFFNKKEQYTILMDKARFIVENKHSFSINVLFSYSSVLEGFNKWYIQLWGESLGKISVDTTRQAFTPIGIVGPVDQHSFLQLIAEGKRDKTVTFIKIEDRNDETTIPAVNLEGLEELNYLDNLSFNQLITHQADATIEALQNMGDIPYDVMTIEKVNERNLAGLMFNYQLLTSLIGNMVRINTYNQPGVESGKIILKDKLKKVD